MNAYYSPNYAGTLGSSLIPKWPLQAVNNSMQENNYVHNHTYSVMIHWITCSQENFQTSIQCN